MYLRFVCLLQTIFLLFFYFNSGDSGSGGGEAGGNGGDNVDRCCGNTHIHHHPIPTQMGPLSFTKLNKA